MVGIASDEGVPGREEAKVLRARLIDDTFKEVTNPKTGKTARILKDQRFYIFENEPEPYLIVG